MTISTFKKLAAGVALFSAATVASAASAKFFNGPICSDNGTTVTCTAKIAGLGSSTDPCVSELETC